MFFNSYRKYFFFILRGWYLRLAVFTIFHEIRGEKKYGIKTSGIDDLSGQAINSENKKYASVYQPANYYLLEKGFQFLKSQDPATNGTLVDFGSGKGRIVSVAAFYDFRSIKGIEFSTELNEIAQQNIENVKTQFPDAEISLYTMDATDYEIQPADCIFTLFNPFERTVMITVVKNILQSLRQYPRDCFIFYLNPVEKEVFLSAGFSEIWYYQKMEYLDFSILFRESQP